MPSHPPHADRLAQARHTTAWRTVYGMDTVVERGREREEEREGERGRERKREKERERGREGEGERGRGREIKQWLTS